MQANLIGNTFIQSTSGRKQNLYLLQEDKEQEYEQANDDADINTEANKIDEDNNDIIVSMVEEYKTV